MERSCPGNVRKSQSLIGITRGGYPGKRKTNVCRLSHPATAETIVVPDLMEVVKRAFSKRSMKLTSRIWPGYTQEAARVVNSTEESARTRT